MGTRELLAIAAFIMAPIYFVLRATDGMRDLVITGILALIFILCLAGVVVTEALGEIKKELKGLREEAMDERRKRERFTS